MSKSLGRLFAVLMALSLVAAACGRATTTTPAATTWRHHHDTAAAKIDYKAIGLWDDGPCDEAKPPLVIGLMTVFESPLLSLKDQATALEVAAEAFNARGGANGSCIEVHTCDDGANVDQAVGVRRRRSTKPAWSRPSTTRAPRARPTCRRPWPQAKIPRVASNVTQDDWADPNAYPIDASGTGVTFLMPQALIEAGATKIGLIRVDLAAASALIRASSRTPTRARPPSPTTRGSRPAPPTTTSSSWARRPREPMGWPSRSARTRPSRSCTRASSWTPSSTSARASARSRTRASPTLATSPSRWCSSGRTRRRPPTSPSTKRSEPTSPPPATRRSSPRTSRPARCGRGSASTPCSR